MVAMVRPLAWGGAGIAGGGLQCRAEGEEVLANDCNVALGVGIESFERVSANGLNLWPRFPGTGVVGPLA
jgi:hypothetical protein